MNGSLRNRLLIAAGVLLAFFLGAAGVILERAFQESLDESIYSGLQSKLFGLMAAMEVTQAGVLLPGVLPESRYSQLDSGLYAEIRGRGGSLEWRSPSLGGRAMPVFSSLPGDFRYYDNLMPANQEFDQVVLVAMGLDIEWEIESGGITTLSLLVAEDRAPYAEQINAYRRVLWIWLGGLAIALLLMQGLLLFWALIPLRRVASELGEVETGARHALNSDYPRELLPLSNRINRFIDHEARQREYQKDVLGDLAHSLKTPLAVMRGLLDESTKLAKSSEANKQLDSMQEIIDHQLQRASSMGRRMFTEPVELAPELARIIRSLGKVYAERDIDFQTQVASGLDGGSLKFFGEKGDLLEILGNLLDNASKHCNSVVRITASAMGGEPERTSRSVCLVVEDDGSGIPEQQREKVMQRGVRADSRTVGHGIGLATVSAVVAGYGGSVEISDSTLGGAKVIVCLPAE
ncbi:MAG: GHKL domain-containing protein [Proteobacteria bacterium]|nr:GHKL domain-containing protein [Pseudomonadota bacterium]